MAGGRLPVKIKRGREKVGFTYFFPAQKEVEFMKIILLGAPGSGKGTQAEFISKEYKLSAISTGNIIREALKSGSELGIRAKSFMDKGDLVPDEIVIEIIKERLAKKDCENGYILDGFPRTIPQAEALDKMGIEIDKVVDIEVSDENILNRISGRRVCEDCGASYHIKDRKPLKEGICDSCNGTLVQRKDDQIETVKSRLTVYHEQTEPLKEYYAKQNKLIIIDGNGRTVEQTKKATLNALEA